MGVIYHAHARFFQNGQKVTLPAPWDPQTPNVPAWYDYLALHAPELRRAGFSAVLLPPSTKSLSGDANTGDGYGVYDHYDIGSKNEMFSLQTRFGNREQLQRAIAVMHACGLDVYGDIVVHQVMGGNNGVYRYFGADGKTMNGRFPKDPGCFRGGWPGRGIPPFCPEDDVPVPADDFAFGDEFSFQHSNPPNYTYTQMIHWGEWLFGSLDLQGGRFDDVKGTWQGLVYQFMQTAPMAGKFFVSEYFDGNPGNLDYWCRSQCGNRSAVFDFPMHFTLEDICNNNASFQSLNGAGYATLNPLNAVTFMDNPDTDLSFGENIISNKLIGYAVILTIEGYPAVYHKDYATDEGCYGLKPWIDNLVWIHENLAFGTTITQYVDDNVIVFNRAGYPGLLTAINKDTWNKRTITCHTEFGPNVELQDYTGRHGNIWTDWQGNATFTVPSNAFSGGQSYLCFSRIGYSQPFELDLRPTTQIFYGAADLDIGPAVDGQTKLVARIWCKAGTDIALAPAGAAAGLSFHLADEKGAVIPAHSKIPLNGWYSIQVDSTIPGATPFAVRASYTATQGIAENEAQTTAHSLAAAAPPLEQQRELAGRGTAAMLARDARRKGFRK
jgi:alpha-amylase